MDDSLRNWRPANQPYNEHMYAYFAEMCDAHEMTRADYQQERAFAAEQDMIRFEREANIDAWMEHNAAWL